MAIGRSILRPRSSKKKDSMPLPWEPVPNDELNDIAGIIQEGLNLPHTPRPFQCRAVKAQLQKRDVLVHAATGMGKTTIVAGPHAHSVTKGRTTFLISPLIALQDEQVSRIPIFE